MLYLDERLFGKFTVYYFCLRFCVFFILWVVIDLKFGDFINKGLVVKLSIKDEDDCIFLIFVGDSFIVDF